MTNAIVRLDTPGREMSSALQAAFPSESGARGLLWPEPMSDGWLDLSNGAIYLLEPIGHEHEEGTFRGGVRFLNSSAPLYFDQAARLYSEEPRFGERADRYEGVRIADVRLKALDAFRAACGDMLP